MATMDIMELVTKCQDILDSLPRSHYLRVSTIDVRLSTTDATSYFNPQQLRIVVAMNNIVEALKTLKFRVSDAELNSLIRGLLYHEISHAILTPRNLMNDVVYYNQQGYKITPSLANIIEDERIETLLKNYYMNVNFKHNLSLIAPIVIPAKNFEHFVFNCVRFRYSPIDSEEVKKQVNRFITLTKNISSGSYSGTLIKHMINLLTYLESLWQQLVQQNQQKSQNQNTEQNGDENGQDSSSVDNSNDDESNENAEGGSSKPSRDIDGKEESKESKSQNAEKGKARKGSSKSSESSQENEVDDLEDIMENADSDNANALSQEDAENHIADTISQICANQNATRRIDIFKSNFETRSKLKAIISRNAGIGVAKAPTIYSQNGSFSERAFIRDKQRAETTYAWFSKRNNGGSQQANASNVKVLNIWLDNSGSYQQNDFETNKILKSLVEIEKSRNDFKFRLIVFGTGFYEKLGNCRVSNSTMGTNLKGLREQYKKYNTTGKEFNIFLMDGTGDNMDELSCLNNKKSALIVDSDVAYVIKAMRLCPNARSIKSVNCSTESYPQLLEQNIIKAFDMLF